MIRVFIDQRLHRWSNIMSHPGDFQPVFATPDARYPSIYRIPTDTQLFRRDKCWWRDNAATRGLEWRDAGAPPTFNTDPY